MRTAAIVPSWTTAVNAAPGSSQPAKAGTIRRCAVLEMGRNSVRPWTMPRTIASNALTRRRGWGSGAASRAGYRRTLRLAVDQLGHARLDVERRLHRAVGGRAVGRQHAELARDLHLVEDDEVRDHAAVVQLAVVDPVDRDGA